MDKLRYYDVVPLAYTGALSMFTYQSEEKMEPGSLVEIPIGRRLSIGVVSGEAAKPSFATRPVARKLDFPAVPEDLRALAGWLQNYYASSPSRVWTTMLPAGLGRKRRKTASEEAAGVTRLPREPLTAEQKAALEAVRNSSKSAFLLQGVTGSGKTRVYLELTAEALASRRSTIILVPEIALTPQTIRQFEDAFGSRVIASHSKLTEAMRHRIWANAARAEATGQPRVIVGPRSCLFMPAHNLGLIVVDECHETTYKQEHHPRYHAVIAAAQRARLTGARLVLGSATPGLNELFLANEGRVEHLYLKNRVNNLPHAEAKILDLRDKGLFKESKFITQELTDLLRTTAADGRQSLLYLNRRGSATSQICGDCGNVSVCPHCRLPLTFHADLMRLVCHHCNFRKANPAVCPECQGANLRLLGGGTKRVEDEIRRLLPDTRIARLDKDSATFSHIKDVIAGLRGRTIDIVIGTQMIAKGLDLPGIDTVGVVNADTMLHMPDFTAAERTFQLLSQVSGRTGRGDRPGRVVIQTYSPRHPAILAAAVGDYGGFAAAELDERHSLSFPPFAYLLKLSIAHRNPTDARAAATEFADRLRREAAATIIGPAPAFLERQSGLSHWVITAKSPQRKALAEIARSLPAGKWTADLDPVNLL